MKLWQSKLSIGALAKYPWDPASPTPKPSVAASKPSPAPSKAHSVLPKVESSGYYNDSSPQNSYRDTVPNGNVGNKRIKIEREDVDYHSSALNPAARAADLLSQQFGSEAAKPVAALQGKAVVSSGGLMLPGARPMQPGQALGRSPLIKTEELDRSQQQQQQQYVMARQKAMDLHQQQQVRSAQRAQAGQTDGPGDDATSHTSSSWSEDDLLRYSSMKEMIIAKSIMLEAGGTLRPHNPREIAVRMEAMISQLPFHSSGSATKSNTLNLGGDAAGDLSLANDGAKLNGLKRERADSEDELDEDAINSDLDDPDEHAIDSNADEDEGQGQIMLCTYDKVARVKNKWKCNLKEGIITINGKE